MSNNPQTPVEERVARYLAARNYLMPGDIADDAWWAKQEPRLREDYLAAAREVIALAQPAVPVPPATHATDEERRERYAKAIRDQVRFRFGASVLALAEQGRPLKMSFGEAETAADAAMAVADAEQAELRRVAAEAQQQEPTTGLEGTLVRVRNLHAPDANGHCGHCHRIHPCPTIDALDHDAEAQQQPDTEFGFVPPAAVNLPAGTLEAAEIGANRLDAWARTPQGRNFLAHALVQLARTGWLRTEPGEGFEPVRDRDETPAPEQPAPGPGRVADEEQPETPDVDPVYDPRAWETYRRDAGCGCTAPAPVDCKVPHGTGAWLCVCHRLSGPPMKETDPPGTFLSSEDEAIRRHFQEPNRCLSVHAGIFRCSRPTGHLGDHRMARTFWGRRAEDDEPAAVAQPEIVHACPPDGSGLTPCCGRTPFELPRGDRISSEAPVTCQEADRG